jgi:glycosyltransferase involved in cell wall biosynthesis
MGHTFQRFAFNLQLTKRCAADSDIVFGMDMDGFTLSGRIHRFVCYVMGVLADEARFEQGVVAQLLMLQARAERHSARRADAVITTSEYSRNRIAQLYDLPRNRIGVVPPAFDVVRWQRDLTGIDFERARTGQPPTVLCVAHMYPRKNIAALIRATRLVTSRAAAIRVRIVGQGPELPRLRKLTASLGISDHIEFLGSLSHADLLREFASCDLFCLPSLQEGFGLVFLEAMASGKAVVACRTSSAPELIQDGVNGLLAQPYDDHDLAEKLVRCLEDTNLRAAMGQANLARAAEYKLDDTAQRLLDLVVEKS